MRARVTEVREAFERASAFEDKLERQVAQSQALDARRAAAIRALEERLAEAQADKEALTKTRTAEEAEEVRARDAALKRAAERVLALEARERQLEGALQESQRRLKQADGRTAAEREAKEAALERQRVQHAVSLEEKDTELTAKERVSL